MAGPDAELEIRVYTGADARFVLYDDAGEGYGYEQGQYARCTLGWSEADAVLSISAREGSYPRHGAGTDGSASGSSAPGPPPRNRPSATRANPSTANSNQPKTDETHPNHSLSDAASDRRFVRGPGQIHGQRRLALYKGSPYNAFLPRPTTRRGKQ